MAGTSSGRGPIVGINVTPMVDVVLVLLVIMMVSATYIVSQSLKVELPKTASSDGAKPEIARVTIAKDGRTTFGDDDVDDAALDRRLRAAHDAHPDLSLVLSADAHAEHGAVVHVIDLAKVAGITKFSIQIERTK